MYLCFVLLSKNTNFANMLITSQITIFITIYNQLLSYLLLS